MTPAEFLLALLLREAPRVAAKPEVLAARSAEVSEAVELDRKVGSAGALVSPEVDPAILDAIRWYEARLQQLPKDGDCHPEAHAGSPQGFRMVCTAHGPMQVRTQVLRLVLGTPEGALAGLGGEATTYRTRTELRTALRNPETGVRAGYAALIRWKGLCGGPPARWITAWGWGRCPPEGVIDREGVRRCELATILLTQRGAAPKAWKCGHEGRKIRDAHDLRLLRWARDQVTNHEDVRCASETEPAPVGCPRHTRADP